MSKKLAINFPFPPVTASRMTVGQVRLLRIPRNKIRTDNLPLYDRLVRCIKNKEAISAVATRAKFKMPKAGAEVIFWIETKDSKRWSQGHEMKPDVDNLTKQLFDALCVSDAHIYSITISKYWCKPGEGRTEIWV